MQCLGEDYVAERWRGPEDPEEEEGGGKEELVLRMHFFLPFGPVECIFPVSLLLSFPFATALRAACSRANITDNTHTHIVPSANLCIPPNI